MNKKGSVIDIIILIAVFTVAVLFFAGFKYGMDKVAVNLGGSTAQILGYNISEASEQTFGVFNQALDGLKWVALAIFFGMTLGIFISNFLVKAHPVFFVVYFLIVVVSIIFSAYVSNSYETLLIGGPLSSILMDYGPVTHIMLNLPIYITVIGIAGAIFLFIGVTVDRESGGSII